MSQLNEQNGLT